MPHKQLRIAIEQEIPGLRVSAGDVDRIAYARDTWPLYQIRLQDGRTADWPGVVVWPTSAAEVAAVYRFAFARGVPVTPVGGGSGVCGGAVPEPGGIALDVKFIDGHLEVCRDDALATADCGWNGWNLERALNRQGVTAGHFPSSIMCSTLGGWFAARGAGQLSTRYGKWDDRFRAVHWVYPDGRDEWVEADGGAGEGILELLAGSEGTLGTAVRMRFRVDPLPAAQQFRAYEFDGVVAGLTAIRRLLHQGIVPAVVRLYDPFDTLLHGSLRAAGKRQPKLVGALRQRAKAAALGAAPDWLTDAGRRVKHMAERSALQEPGFVQSLGERLARHALLVLMFEGPAEIVAWQARRSDELLNGEGKSLGEAPARAWYDARYHVSFKQAALYEQGGFVDTMEVAFPWSKIEAGYHAVRKALHGDVLVMAHFSHVYDTGGSIYFTFSGWRKNPDENERLYREVWRRGLDAVVRSGGTITHHHGVGILKAKWLADEWGDGAEWMRNVKAAVDPERVANPGKLGL